MAMGDERCKGCGPSQLCLQLGKRARCVQASCENIILHGCGAYGVPRCTMAKGDCAVSQCELGDAFCVHSRAGQDVIVAGCDMGRFTVNAAIAEPSTSCSLTVPSIIGGTADFTTSWGVSYINNEKNPSPKEMNLTLAELTRDRTSPAKIYRSRQELICDGAIKAAASICENVSASAGATSASAMASLVATPLVVFGLIVGAFAFGRRSRRQASNSPKARTHIRTGGTHATQIARIESR